MNAITETPVSTPTAPLRQSPQVEQIAAALAAAQGRFETPERNRTVKVRTRDSGSYEFSYATLDTVLAAVRPALAENGLSIVQTVEADRGLRLCTRLLHASGQWIESVLPLPDLSKGPQAFGSGRPTCGATP